MVSSRALWLQSRTLSQATARWIKYEGIVVEADAALPPLCVMSNLLVFSKRDSTPRMLNFEGISILGKTSSFCAKRCVSILIWMQQERILGGRPWAHHPLTGWAPLGNCCIFLHLIWKECFGVHCFQSALGSVRPKKIHWVRTRVGGLENQAWR